TWVLLLVSALNRQSLLYGKLLTTVLVVAAALAVCLFGLLIVSHLGTNVGVEESTRFGLEGTLITALLCVPLAVSLSALYFLLAICARTTQEASIFTSAVMIVAMCMSMACIVPDKFIAPAMYLVPVVNVSVCLGQALQTGINANNLIMTVA